MNAAMPSDYEKCAVCGYDHEYDFAYLTRAEIESAHRAHAASEQWFTAPNAERNEERRP